MAFEAYYNLKEKKKDNIMKAIISCLSKHDYDDISINDIAVAADISRGSFYNYFADKYDSVYTLAVSKFELLESIFKENIKDSDGKLFVAAKKTYENILSTLKNEYHYTIVKNIKLYMGIVMKIVYSKGYAEKLDELLDWLLVNTVEGKNKIKNKKEMANILELFISLYLNTTARALTDIDNSRKYDDFDYKLNIIKNGIK